MKFELTYKPLRKIFYWFFGFIILFLFFGDYLYELKYGRSSGNSNSLEITGIIFTFVLLFPSLLITLFYLKENFKTDFQIIKKKRIIKINSNNILKTYDLDQIESVIYHRQSYRKDLFWNAFSCYSDLGYVDLTFKNKERYFLTSFLINTNQEPIFDNSRIKYSFLPFIDRTDPKLIKEKTEKQTKKRIEKLKCNFNNKSITELNEMLDNKTKYQNEAIIAINEILKRKKNVG
jgi:hypothetical protein